MVINEFQALLLVLGKLFEMTIKNRNYIVSREM